MSMHMTNMPVISMEMMLFSFRYPREIENLLKGTLRPDLFAAWLGTLSDDDARVAREWQQFEGRARI